VTLEKKSTATQELGALSDVNISPIGEVVQKCSTPRSVMWTSAVEVPSSCCTGTRHRPISGAISFRISAG
jgi:hypothetical protein